MTQAPPSPQPCWGVCTTVRAPVEQVLAFVTHYLDLGAHRIWVHFDDPDDPGVKSLADLRRVVAVPCDAAHWQAMGRRPEKHQRRQVRNLTRIYRRTGLDFLAHFDVDEYLLADRPVPEILADLPADQAILRVEPYEALHDPTLPDDIFTARHFRRQPQPEARGVLARLFGHHAPYLPQGMLSHTVGKCFFRTGIADIEPGIHGARLGETRLPGGAFHPDLALLHFHAEDPRRWLDDLPFRLTKGAYQSAPALQAHLLRSSPEEARAFYDAVQVATPAMVQALGEAGLLRIADLRLRERIASRGV